MTSVGASQRTTARRFLKRSFDVVVAAAALVLTLPVALFAGLAIKLTSPGGPVLVREVRVGKDGKHFEMLKLRTTTSFGFVASRTDVSSPESTCETPSETSGDQRVTAVGRVLRTCSIDELPQWWNVVRGDMSVVGPPPSVPSGPKQTPDRDRPVGVPPGLTGMWRASRRRASPGCSQR